MSGTARIVRAFPYDEIRVMKWNGGPNDVSGGYGGTALFSPTPYLIAYWKLRYFGPIAE